MNLLHQRCFNHAGREAVARCPRCARYYCRECVSEHQNQLICASCLAKQTEPKARDQLHWDWLARFFSSSLGLVLAWMFFYCLGKSLLAIPSSFHDAAVWSSFWNSP